MGYLSIESLGQKEQQIIERAKWIYISRRSEKPFIQCIREAMEDILRLDDVSFLRLFDISVDEYINQIYEKVKNNI